VLLTAVRCDCGSKLQWGTEQTERGLRWTFTCEGCGSRWGHRGGVFRRLDRGDSVQQLGDGTPEELELLACFRRLSRELQSEVLAYVQALVRPRHER
jgi:GTP cyclohydrolase II